MVYSDDDIVVVDKPVGVAAHPSPGWTGPTVIGGLAAMGHTIATSGAAERQGVVHRLDVGHHRPHGGGQERAGVQPAQAGLQGARGGQGYHAVVQGHLDPLRGTIDAPIDRHPTHDYKWAVVSGGRPSITHYDTLEAFPAASLVDVHLETGRTHQIRVHFSALRHPCVGDLTYGADPTLAARLGLTRQWLHARELASRTRRPARRSASSARTREDLAHALEVLRARPGGRQLGGRILVHVGRARGCRGRGRRGHRDGRR